MSFFSRQSPYLLIAAFAAGAGVAALVVALIVVFTGGDGDDDDLAVVSPTPGSPAATTLPPGPTPGAAEATEEPTTVPAPTGPTDPEEAIAAYVADQLGSEYLGACAETPGGQPGICSVELFRSEQLATFLLGPPFSEATGQAVLQRAADGSWSVSFVPAPPLGETLAVGSNAVVFGVGSCLRFRALPSTDAEVLSCRLAGANGEVVEGPQQAGGLTWWRLEDLGWASDQFLAATP